jgi:hypothetical protein
MVMKQPKGDMFQMNGLQWGSIVVGVENLFVRAVTAGTDSLFAVVEKPRSESKHSKVFSLKRKRWGLNASGCSVAQVLRAYEFG